MRNMLGGTLDQSLEFYDLLMKIKGALKANKNTPEEIFISLTDTFAIYKQTILLHMSKT